MPLRILHTSDWHLGHALHGFDRAAEHALFLEWLLSTLAAEDVDALLVAGDVFDAANPPAEALRQWYGFLAAAWTRLPRLQVVVIGGNHDSAVRLDATDPFLRALGRLHVVGGAARGTGGALELDRHVWALEDRAGRRAAWVAAVPHLRVADTGSGDEAAVSEGTRRVYDAILGAARARRRPGEALLAMGHLYLVGAQVSSLSERRLTVGNQSAVGGDLFPDDVAYAALGHLHLAQPVGGRDHVRYSGSPLPLSLDERAYPHQVVVVDLDGDRLAGWRAVRVPRWVELPRVPERGEAGADEALAAIAALPGRGGGPEHARPLLHVEVRLDRPDPTLAQRVQAALRGKEARLALLRVATPARGGALPELGGRSLAELAPDDVFRARWQREFEGEPPPSLWSAFRELLESVHAERP